MDHHQYPFDMLQEHLKREGMATKNTSLFDIFFNYHIFKTLYIWEGMALEFHVHEKNKEFLPLSVDVYELENRFTLRFLSAEVYDRESLNYLAQRYFRFLEEMIDHGDLKIVEFNTIVP